MNSRKIATQTRNCRAGGVVYFSGLLRSTMITSGNSIDWARQRMKKMPRPGLFVAAALCALIIAMGSARANADVTVIDSFQDRPTWFPLVVGYGYESTGIVVSFPHVLGGRAVSLAATTPGLRGSYAVEANINDTDASTLLEYSSLSVGAAGNLTLEYGTPNANSIGNPPPTRLGLSVNPNTDFLRLTFASYNHANAQDMSLNVVLGSGISPDDSTVHVSTALISPGSQTLDIPLTDLLGNSLDFIQFAFSAPPDTAFQLDSVALITNVPEPSTVASLLAGCMLLFPRLRRPSRYNRRPL
jgi:hypothetical protein